MCLVCTKLLVSSLVKYLGTITVYDACLRPSETQVICDVLALEEAGHVSPTVLEDVLAYISQEDQFAPLLAYDQCYNMVERQREGQRQRQRKRKRERQRQRQRQRQRPNSALQQLTLENCKY